MNSKEWLRCHWKPRSIEDLLSFCLSHSSSVLPASSARSTVSESKNKYQGHHRRHPQGIPYLVSWMLAFQISSILVSFHGFPSHLAGEMTAILERTKLSGFCFIFQNRIISLRLVHEKLVVWLPLIFSVFFRVFVLGSVDMSF